jgi:hypothetical protein
MGIEGLLKNSGILAAEMQFLLLLIQCAGINVRNEHKKPKNRFSIE